MMTGHRNTIHAWQAMLAKHGPCKNKWIVSCETEGSNNIKNYRDCELMWKKHIILKRKARSQLKLNQSTAFTISPFCVKLWAFSLQFTDKFLTGDTLLRSSIRRNIAFYILESRRFTRNLVGDVHAFNTLACCPILLHRVIRGFSSRCSRISAT